MIKQTAATLLFLGMTAIAAQAAETRIERLAPANSFIVASIRNFEATTEHLKATKLWSLWHSEELADTRAQIVKDYEEALKIAMDELGVDEKSIPMPHGAVSLAIFSVLNDDLGVNQPSFLLVADYGPEADKAASLVDAALKKGQESGELLIDEEAVLGHTVYSVKPKEAPKAAKPHKPDDEEDGDEGGMMGPDGLFPGLPDVFKSAGKMHYVRDGSVLILSTDRPTLDRALDPAQDADTHGRVAESSSFQQLMSQVGETDAWGVILLDNLGAMLGAEAQMAAVYTAMVKNIIGNIAAIGLGAQLDTPSAMVEFTGAIHMPDGTAGITSLLDTQVPRGSLPAFVPSDVLSYSTFNFEFSGLPGVIRQFVNANAMLMGANPEEILAQMDPILQLLSKAIGSEVHSVTTLSLPIKVDSLHGVYAVRCLRPADVHAFMSEHAPMLGMQPRQFLGQSMWTMDPDMGGFGMLNPMMAGGGMSVGLGGGFVFIGVTSAVEQSLRSAGAEAESRLTDSPMYKRATAALPAGPEVGWGFSNLAQEILAMRDIGVLTERHMIEEARQFDPDYAKELEKELAARKPTPWDKIDAAMLQRYIGPVAWRLAANDHGFVGKCYLLPPGE